MWKAPGEEELLIHAGTRLRVSSVSLALTAAVALTLAAVPQGGAGPVMRYVATYRITVTTSVTTEKIRPGVADNFRGAVSFTCTYPRVAFERYLTGGVATRGNLRGGGRPTGTAVARYDHQGDSCGPEPCRKWQKCAPRAVPVLSQDLPDVTTT